ncbi:hypothetical protein K474DRAFT_1774616 [Panus rudis PR-1116 ss-1]|nr:hypothetical protein K474DRAFT_1774616 [Panus rudis PR-1116 ss-1]
MSTTTQILYNSPALHSLKRDQLVKLCKIHGLKANGKNVELIERLKQRATELPPDGADDDQAQNLSDIDTPMSPMSDNSIGMAMPRPSEQWEMVMEDIQEVDESTLGTMSSNNTLRSNRTAGEFGTSHSKTSVTSSLKAFANSLGIKRIPSTSNKSLSSHKDLATTAEQDELDNHAVPYSDLPPAKSLPSTDHFKLSTPDVSMTQDDSLSEPVPGHPFRPGAPAPSNARLSTGEGLTTTIRLITTSYPDPIPSPPRLAPVSTSFDLVMNSPASGGQPVWPASPKPKEQLYPAIPMGELQSLADIQGTISRSQSPAKPMPTDAPDIFSPSKPTKPASSSKTPASAAKLSLPRSEPFLFGSPLPQHRLSNNDFGKAADSVLAEMNKRLAEAGVAQVEKGVLEKKDKGDVFGDLKLTNHQRTTSTDRFANVHEKEFSKMDSIANHYAARRVQPQSKKRKSEALGHGAGPAAKRKSSVAGHTGQRVISNGVRKNMTIPGGFGGDEDDDEEEEVEAAGDRRSSKRIRVTGNEDITQGRRVSIAPPPQTEEERRKDEQKKDREREVVKRKLEARRRSSRGRASLAGKAAPPKGKSRFGFLSSAKSIVRNVWNFGSNASGTNAKSSAPASNIPVPKPANVPKPAEKESTTNTASSKKSSIGLGHASVKSATSSRVSSAQQPSITQEKENKPGSVGHARAPIPSFAQPTKASSAATATAASRKVSGSGAPPSSMGTRTSVAPSGSNVNSMGAKRSLGTTPAGTAGSRKRADSTVGSASKIPLLSPAKRPSSTLMAPTASSLAKAQANMRSPPNSRSSDAARLRQITNSPAGVKSPRPTKIFSQPLTTDMFKSPTSAPTPSRDVSLAQAAKTMMGNNVPTSTSNASVVPPKPKALAARRPRISRTKVIAKLGAQRAAASGSAAVSKDIGGGRTRSSVGAARRSMGVVKNNRASVGNEVVMSAKKRARQSEYARRRSQAKTAGRASLGLEKRRQSGAMDVDD